MLEKHALSDQSIISCLSAHYGIEVDRLIFLPIGADVNASLYKAERAGGAGYFLKVKEGHHPQISVEIVELLHWKGIQQIILPIQTKNGKSTQPLEDFTLIVYPFVVGEDGFKRELTRAQWVKLGKALRRVHEVEVPPSMENRIRKESYSPKWREAVRSLYPHVEAEASTDEIGAKLQKFMLEKMPAIQRLVDRAEQLGEKLRSRSTKFVLCHSDIHAGNVLLEGKDEIYIVDWDEPIMAPKERDLMFIGGGVGNVWNRLVEESLFYQGYGAIEIDQAILAYYRHERIVEDIAIYGQQLLLSSTGGKNRLEMYQHFLDLFEPRGVVDIALTIPK